MVPRRASVIAALLSTAFLVGGCDGTPGPVKSTPPFATEEEAFAAAEATYRAYVDALNRVDLSDPETFEPVFALTTDEANAAVRTSLSQMHADLWTVSGESIVTRIHRGTTSAGFLTASLDICLDVSDVKVVDAQGDSVVEPNRVDVQAMRIGFVAKPSVDRKWLISALDGREGPPACDS